jgi:hypothetical protein
LEFVSDFGFRISDFRLGRSACRVSAVFLRPFWAEAELVLLGGAPELPFGWGEALGVFEAVVVAEDAYVNGAAVHFIEVNLVGAAPSRLRCSPQGQWPIRREAMETQPIGPMPPIGPIGPMLGVADSPNGVTFSVLCVLLVLLYE